jgi:membrane-bound serine protease (ClpP class)
VLAGDDLDETEALGVLGDLMRAIPALLLIHALLLTAAPLFAAEAEGAPAPVAMIRLDGAIDVPSSEYLTRALKVAEERGAQCLLILLNTPGGLGEPMKDMTEALLNAPLPTVVYVFPAGAYAISAGTFITLSAHIAAMQPATTIGAAHPVSLFSMPSVPEPPKEELEKTEGEGEDESEAEDRTTKISPDVMMEKVVNTFALQARVIAEARGRNADWAEQAVRESVVLSAKDAVEHNVVDLVAEDVDDLLNKIDGTEVRLPGRRTAVLRTIGAAIEEIPPTVKERFLHVLASADLLLVLLVLAGLGIMFELQNPGAILPGVIGGLSLLLALYSMAVLPVNYAGVGLILFGMLLLLAEVKIVSHGVLTVGGIASFVTGALMLMDTDTPFRSALTVSWQVIVFMALLLLGFFLFVIGAAVRAHMRKVQTGEQGMLGGKGRALTALNPKGRVLVEGERWRARAADGGIEEGHEIQVVGQEGFLLIVQGRGGTSTQERS